MPCNLFFNPFSQSNFLHAVGIWDDIGMVAYAIDDRAFTEGIKTFTRKLNTFIAVTDIMYLDAVTKSVFTLLTDFAHIIRHTPMALSWIGRTCPAE